MKSLLPYFIIIVNFKCATLSGQSDSSRVLLPKKYFTLSIGGESGIVGIGYSRSLIYQEKFKLFLETKFSYLPEQGFLIPIGISSEIFDGTNKLIVGVSLGNKFRLNYSYTSWDDVEKIKKNPELLKGDTPFLYVPYGSLSIGYKKYLKKNRAISVYINGITYPSFESLQTGVNLSMRLMPFGGITYYLPLNKMK